MDKLFLKQIKFELLENGIVKIPKFILKKELILIQSDLMSELKRLNIYANNKIVSKDFKKMAPFQQVVSLSKLIRKPQLLQKYVFVFNDILVGLFDSYFDFDIEPQLLLTLPQQENWTLNDLKWHVDSFSDLLNSLQFFLLIDDVESHGGGTLILKGSHILKKRYSLTQLNHFLSTKTLDEVFEIENKKFLLNELKGTAGDVYLMDMRVLHSPSINASNKIRMMATYRFHKRDY
nr:phytanoyl-CoA dioxygenase family protein [Acinetobacter sp. Marseille-Q1620]